jgi:thiol-disulfide isomerase/thioredoxin
MKRALAVFALASTCALSAAYAQQNLRRAPSWSLYDSNGKMHDLLDYRGKIVVLDIMQTGCPHCGAFADVLHKVEQKYGDKVQVISVVTILGPAAETPDKVKTYVANHKVDYPILYDMGQMQYSYLLTPKADLPHAYIIDPNGYVRADYGYNMTSKDFFEGNGIFTELDRLVNAQGKK